jgi:hypothetical protein
MRDKDGRGQRGRRHRLPRTLLHAVVLTGVACVVIVVPPSGAHAETVAVEPIPPSAPGSPPWRPSQLTDGGYLIGASFVDGYDVVARGPDVPTTRTSDLDWPAQVSTPAKYGLRFTAINDRGIVAGVHDVVDATSGPFLADLHDRSVVMLDDDGYAGASINRLAFDGTAVGSLHTPAPTEWVPHGAAWVGPDHTLVLVDDLGFGSVLTDINGNGRAAGWMRDGSGDAHPATWNLPSGSAPVDLAPVTGEISEEGITINDAGDVLVQLGPPYASGPFGVVEHGTSRLVRLYEPGFGVYPVLNNVGQAAFFAWTGPSRTGDTSFTILDIATGERTVIPVPPDGADAETPFLNDRGQIGATLRTSDGRSVAQIWDPGRGWIELRDADGRDLILSTLNSTGMVAGFYVDTRQAWTASVPIDPQPPATATEPEPRVAPSAVSARPAFTG